MRALNMPELNTANNAVYTHTETTVQGTEEARSTHTVGFEHMI